MKFGRELDLNDDGNWRSYDEYSWLLIDVLNRHEELFWVNSRLATYYLDLAGAVIDRMTLLRL